MKHQIGEHLVEIDIPRNPLNIQLCFKLNFLPQIRPYFSDIWTAPKVKEENRRITCGSTIVNDRFIVFAAHCETDFKPSG